MKTPRSLLALFFGLLLLAVAAPDGFAAERLEKMERHPEIHQAIRSLEKAKMHMEAAQHDFGGHRREALEACERAIRQLRLALESDRR